MAERELGFEIDLGHGLVEFRKIEQRIVAEAAGAARAVALVPGKTAAVPQPVVSADSRIRFITYEGQQILYVDFSNGSLDDMHTIIRESIPVVRSQRVKSLLMLTNVHDLAFNPASAGEMRKYAQGNEPFVFAAAVVGLDGLKRIVYETIRKASGQNMMAFSDVEEAKQWLVERKNELVMDRPGAGAPPGGSQPLV